MRVTHIATRPVAGRINPTAILAIILISYFIILLDNSIIFTGLPSIQSSMGYSATGLSWVQDAYTLVFGGLLLLGARLGDIRSEEHTSELQSLMRISYAVFCLKNKNANK